VPIPRRLAPWWGAAAALFAVGWGANQFSSLLLSYRLHEHLSETTSDALFGVYAVGLVPALLIGGPLSDRHGRRLVVPVVALSAVATVILMAGGPLGQPALYTGRFVAGVVSGLAFAPGTAWVKELSGAPWGDAGEQVGARRAAIALSAGFGAGPLVAGLLAQWAPAPTVLPYVPHLVVLALVAPLVVAAPETVVDPHRPPVTAGVAPAVRAGTGGAAGAGRVGAGRLGGSRAAGRQPPRAPGRFGGMAAPMAPWVFGAAAISFAVLPATVTRATRSYEVAFAAVVAGVTLLAGVLIQSAARRLDARSEATGMQAGLGLVTVGLLVGALAASTAQPVLVLAAAAVLGAGYGTCLVSGLLEVQRIADPDRLAGLTAVFYALTYVGFAAPIALAGLRFAATTPQLLLAAAGLCAVTLAAVATGRARHVHTP
jgi:MFS family permease